MIELSMICPHPPIIIPGIGNNNDLMAVKETISAMDRLGKDIEEKEIDTIVLVTPHNLIFNNCMGIFDYQKFIGNFGQFNKSNISMNFDANNDLIDAIAKQCEKQEIEINTFNNGSETGDLDHGAMVPLYYLTKYVGNNIKLVLITYSHLDRLTHIKFGETISQICNSDIFKDERIALVASGDMSHRLFSGAPAGYSDEGKEFDQILVRDLKNDDYESISSYDEEWVEAAGECGYRSILILIGTFHNKIYNCQILSYQGPFGVGYLVAKFLPQ